jgi:hypothetical protein
MRLAAGCGFAFGSRSAEQLTERLSHGLERALGLRLRTPAALHIGDEVGQAFGFAAVLDRFTASAKPITRPLSRMVSTTSARLLELGPPPAVVVITSFRSPIGGLLSTPSAGPPSRRSLLGLLDRLVSLRPLPAPKRTQRAERAERVAGDVSHRAHGIAGDVSHRARGVAGDISGHVRGVLDQLFGCLEYRIVSGEEPIVQGVDPGGGSGHGRHFHGVEELATHRFTELGELGRGPE